MSIKTGIIRKPISDLNEDDLSKACFDRFTIDNPIRGHIYNEAIQHLYIGSVRDDLCCKIINRGGKIINVYGGLTDKYLVFIVPLESLTIAIEVLEEYSNRPRHMLNVRADGSQALGCDIELYCLVEEELNEDKDKKEEVK